MLNLWDDRDITYIMRYYC